MKKLLAEMLTAAAVMSVSATSFAAVSYDVTDKYVTADEAKDMKTVIVTKGAEASDTVRDSDIFYVGQAESGATFAGATQFLLKETDLLDGAYTITFGADGKEPVSKTFYIGMTDTKNDVELTRITGEKGETTNNDNTKNIGYKTDSATGIFKGIVIKTDGKYYGVKLNTDAITVSGAAVGIQINGITEEQATNTKVWLTSRDFTVNDRR